MQTWITRLGEQLPGWHVWRSDDGPRWNAVPAPADISHTDALGLPDRVGADTPQALRALCQTPMSQDPRHRRYRDARYHQPRPETSAFCPDPENCIHTTDVVDEGCECCGAVIAADVSVVRP